MDEAREGFGRESGLKYWLYSGAAAVSEVEQIEKRIESLSSEDLAKFRAWFLSFDAQRWDAQIEADANAGKLDKLIDESVADYHSGKSKEL